VLGVGASLAAGRAIASLIVGVSPYDPAVYAAIVAMTIVLAAAASALAARRAAAVDPVELMRAE
jgi:ABC-type lipoprotein release transport system permease subunit